MLMASAAEVERRDRERGERLRETLDHIVEAQEPGTIREQLIAAVALERYDAGDWAAVTKLLHRLPDALGSTVTKSGNRPASSFSPVGS